jgi:hypothetical protein
MPSCSHCGATVSENAVLCIECGYDFRTGKRHTTEIDRSPDFVDFQPGIVANIGRLVLGWLAIGYACLLVLGALAKNDPNRAHGVFLFVLAILGAIWLLVSFRRTIRVSAYQDEFDRPIVEITRTYGVLKFIKRECVSPFKMVWLFQGVEDRRASQGELALLALHSPLSALLESGRDNVVVRYRVELRNESGQKLVLLKSDERFKWECSQTARMLRDVLKLPLHQDLQLL